MLTLVLGKAGSGKSRWCLEEAAELAHRGRQSVLVVPEQVAYTFERELVERLPGTLGGACEVKSFKRLCRDLMNERGGAARQRLDEAQKAALVRRAVIESAGQLQYYRRRSRDAAFYPMLCRLFDELRNAGGTPEKLRAVAASCSGLTAQKLGEVALLQEKYEALLARGFFDDAGELAFAASLCAGARTLAGKTVFVDGFSGFTAAERSFLAALLTAAGDVAVTLCCTGEESDAAGALAMACKTAGRLTAQCERAFGRGPRLVRLTEDHRHKAAGLRAAEAYFRAGETPDLAADGVSLLTGDDLYAEAARTADELMRLVREEGYRFREIAVTVRDAPRYREALCRTFGRFGIPYLFDESETLLTSPATVFLLAALGMAGGRVRTEELLRLLKTGICAVSEEEISLLENYAFVHGVEGDAWLAPFAENPDGFGDVPAHAAKRLARTEEARAKVAGWLAPYLEAAPRCAGAALLREAYALMERCGAVSGLKAQNGPGRRSAQLAFTMIERLNTLLGEEWMPREELCDLLRLLASSTKAAEIPTSADAVLIGEADRSMPFNPRAMFLLGLNDGVFPREGFEGLIFTMEERDLLYENELLLAGSFEECCDMEAAFLYAAVSAPSERLYLSWCGADGDGAAARCAELEGFARHYGLAPLPAGEAAFVVNTATARERYADARSEGEAKCAAALEQSEAGDACLVLAAALERAPMRIADPALARALAGEEISLSASKIDAFEDCRFLYFLKYGLGVQPLRKAQLSSLEAGSFVHDVMEKLFKKLGGDLTEADEQALAAVCRAEADAYMDSLLPPEKRSPRMQAMAENLEEASLRLALRLQAEQRQSRFRAADCELVIGAGGEVPAAQYPLPDGGKAVVVGKIDRVDTYTEDGVTYLRIVDYKTGEKNFDLAQVWQGLNIQMLLYLFALGKGAPQRYGAHTVAAGVLYQPSDPSPETEEKDARKAYTPSGLLLGDPQLLAAMEPAGEGLYIPVSAKDFGKADAKSLASAEEFGRLSARIDAIVTGMAQALREGDAEARPAWEGDGRGDHDACRYCDYKAVCGQDRITEVRQIKKLKKNEIFAEGERADG